MIIYLNQVIYEEGTSSVMVQGCVAIVQSLLAFGGSLIFVKNLQVWFFNVFRIKRICDSESLKKFMKELENNQRLSKCRFFIQVAIGHSTSREAPRAITFVFLHHNGHVRFCRMVLELIHSGTQAPSQVWKIPTGPLHLLSCKGIKKKRGKEGQAT